MTPCSQCGKPALYEVNGHPICVDCYLKIQQAAQIRHNALTEQANYLTDQMEAVSGVYGVLPRYQTQTPIINQGPMNFHSIRIDRSVVGAVNTGTVRKMEVALNNIHALNQNAELEQHLKAFTEAVLHEEKLSAEAKNDVVDQLSVLATQLAVPEEGRVVAVTKALMTSIAANIASTGLLAQWGHIRHLLGF